MLNTSRNLLHFLTFWNLNIAYLNFTMPCLYVNIFNFSLCNYFIFTIQWSCYMLVSPHSSMILLIFRVHFDLKSTVSWRLFISLNITLDSLLYLPSIKCTQKFIILFSITAVTFCLPTSLYTIQFAVLLFSFSRLFKNFLCNLSIWSRF